jgi:polysaccharide pyruvyl transferase WcaK-like protein
MGVSLKLDKHLTGQHIQYFAEKISKKLSELENWQLLLIPCFPEEDLPVLYELYEITSKKLGEQRVVLLDNFGQFSSPEQVGIIASCEVFVGMRYHALLSAISNHRPVLGIVYDPKVKSLLEFAGQVSFSLKDDPEHPWNYFWQNIKHSAEQAKLAKEKALKLHQNNLLMLEKLKNM